MRPVQRMQPKRAVLLIQMDNGLQLGYEVTHVREARVEWDDQPLGLLDWRCPTPATGTITVNGQMHGMMRMPDGFFEEPPGLPAATPELET